MVSEVLHSPGAPLDASVRAVMEPRFGHDLSQVRVHTDARAGESARALHALAYTVSPHIVFAAEHYAPDTPAGLRLLTHELTHIIQQARAGTVPDRIIQRQEAASGEGVNLPPVQVPGTALTLLPGPLELTQVQGLRLPLPASLRLTNALGVGPGPTFVLDLSPRLLVGTILDNIDLSVSTTAGTPPESVTDPRNQDRIRLIRPIFSFNPAERRLRGSATLSVPTGYPQALVPPTEVDVDVESTELGQFTGHLGYGPLHADFTLQLHYNTGRLEQAIRPAFTPQGGVAGFWLRLQTILRDTVPGVQLENVSEALQSLLRSVLSGNVQAAEFATRTIALLRDSIPAGVNLERLQTVLGQLATELTHPGFTLTGGLRLGPIPLSSFQAEAPTTVPLQRPLLGAPTPFPLTHSAYGVVLAPPGSITDVTVPAFGYVRSAFGERTGTSVTTALLPTLSPAAISAGRPLAEQFPVYAYAEISHVRRVSERLDLGIRLTAQLSTATLFGGGAQASQDPNERIRQAVQQYQEATRQGGTPAPPLPNLGVTVFGAWF
jgi:hypothetical protein